MTEHRFFKCEVCGNIIGVIQASGAPISCCGKNMTELVPNTVDASQEKHVPVVEVQGNLVTVKVGDIAHPMLEEHFIQWIYLETVHGGQRKALVPGTEPEAVFALTEGDKAVAAYEYCNLHGLWKKDI